MSEKKSNRENGRFSVKRKSDAVLRLLRGEELELLSREYGVTAGAATGPAVGHSRGVRRARRRSDLGRSGRSGSHRAPRGLPVSDLAGHGGGPGREAGDYFSGLLATRQVHSRSRTTTQYATAIT